MNKLSEFQINTIIELLKQGKQIPEEFRWLLFEEKQQTDIQPMTDLQSEKFLMLFQILEGKMSIKKWLKLCKNHSHLKEKWQELARLLLRAPVFLAIKHRNLLKINVGDTGLEPVTSCL